MVCRRPRWITYPRKYEWRLTVHKTPKHYFKYQDNNHNCISGDDKSTSPWKPTFIGLNHEDVLLVMYCWTDYTRVDKRQQWSSCHFVNRAPNSSPVQMVQFHQQKYNQHQHWRTVHMINLMFMSMWGPSVTGLGPKVFSAPRSTLQRGTFPFLIVIVHSAVRHEAFLNIVQVWWTNVWCSLTVVRCGGHCRISCAGIVWSRVQSTCHPQWDRLLRETSFFRLGIWN